MVLDYITLTLKVPKLKGQVILSLTFVQAYFRKPTQNNLLGLHLILINHHEYRFSIFDAAMKYHAFSKIMHYYERKSTWMVLFVMILR